ncbi:hypothetical protein [Chitinophaga sp. YIM B06452]|uniref:hypothetical protein n=1 Tax=Chitinophaga sp. YIM B06452 TaxID=3082158 RepID=UPI0031FEA67E
MNKYSMLGLPLLAASIVTAALVPISKTKAIKQQRCPGHLTMSTGNQPDETCRAPHPGDVLNCTYTLTGNNNLNVGFSSTSANVVGSNSGSVTQLAFTFTFTEPPCP